MAAVAWPAAGPRPGVCRSDCGRCPVRGGDGPGHTGTDRHASAPAGVVVREQHLHRRRRLVLHCWQQAELRRCCRCSAAGNAQVRLRDLVGGQAVGTPGGRKARKAQPTHGSHYREGAPARRPASQAGGAVVGLRPGFSDAGLRRGWLGWPATVDVCNPRCHRMRGVGSGPDHLRLPAGSLGGRHGRRGVAVRRGLDRGARGHCTGAVCPACEAPPGGDSARSAAGRSDHPLATGRNKCSDRRRGVRSEPSARV
jgi:hypothetical protein